VAEEATLQIRSDKRAYPPWALAGGSPGSPSLNVLNPGPGETVLPTLNSSTIRRGDVVRHVLASGGGWGDPLRRDREAVRRDVWNEKLSAEQAARDYGVVVDPEGRAVDAEATERLRTERLRRRAP
jgi:N-methylhydantoinase B